jgi:hypothetical protein
MEKSRTERFDVQSGRVIRYPTEKGKNMSISEENGSAGEKRTDKKVRIDFIGPEGGAHKHPVEGCKEIRANFIEAGGEQEILRLNELDEDMIYRLAAFGASVLGRNEVNTTKEEEGPETAADNLRSRWNGFRNNSYRSVSSGSATPLILLALERALRAAGVPEEKVGEKVSTYRAAYDAGEDEKQQAKSRREVSKQLRAVPEVKAAEKAIRDEREQARADRGPQVSLSSL